MSRLGGLWIHRFTLVAIGFELSLGLLGGLLSWAVGDWPVASWPALNDPALGRDVAIGVLAAVPFGVALVLIDRHPVGMFRSLERTVREDVLPLFRGISAPGLLAIAGAAGLGEELLFRGFLQQTLASWWSAPAGPWLAWLVAALAFGLCHSLCAAYAVVATVMGVALGGLYWATGHLVAPVTMHAVYDGWALLYLVWWSRARATAPRDTA